MPNLTEKDLNQLRRKGIPQTAINEQLRKLKDGFPNAQLAAPCTLKNGLLSIEQRMDELVDNYRSIRQEFNIVKFVPASGAASRMFKHLFAFLENPKDISDAKTQEFIQSLPNFPFTNLLNQSMAKNGLDLESSLNQKDYQTIIHHLLSEEGLNYGSLPKALIAFHLDQKGNERTPIDEHLEEGALYAKGKNKVVNLHFTVSPEHLAKIESYVSSRKAQYEQKYNVSYNINYSLQQPSTDTVALGEDGEIFREEDGTLLFRPSGHGALLNNLQEIDADLIFIKNIDNVVPSYKHEASFKYKEAMGGLLIELKKEVDQILWCLKDKLPLEDDLVSIYSFIEKSLRIPIDSDQIKENPKTHLTKILNKPLRICGMVKNEGAPGGGPFWVKDPKGRQSLQIVESSQIDLTNPEQKEVFENSTHFNPVDIVCSIKDFEGNRFELQQFRDESTGLISEKSKNGKSFKALELPGLWNGSMANWISVFIEIPIETFNPVKTVNDLLKPMHK